MQDVGDIFHMYRDRPIVAKNSAPHSGAAYWVRGLMERIEEPMSKLKTLNKIVLETDLAKEIMRTYDHLMEEMGAFKAKAVEAWCVQVAATSDEKLNLPLLQTVDRTPEGVAMLGVNFDPALIRLLRETKYFLLLQFEVPETARTIFESSDTFRQQISSLDLICSIHNKIQRTILPVEKPLVQQKLEEVEKTLQRGESELNWKSEGIDGYIRECMELVKDVDLTLTTIKDNVKATEGILKAWEKNLMFERKDGKTYTFDELSDSFNQLIQLRHSEIRDAGKEITKLLSSSNRVLKVSKGVPSWKAYVDYFSAIVINGFSSAITCTVRYLMAQVGAGQRGVAAGGGGCRGTACVCVFVRVCACGGGGCSFLWCYARQGLRCWACANPCCICTGGKAASQRTHTLAVAAMRMWWQRAHGRDMPPAADAHVHVCVAARVHRSTPSCCPRARPRR